MTRRVARAIAPFLGLAACGGEPSGPPPAPAPARRAPPDASAPAAEPARLVHGPRAGDAFRTRGTLRTRHVVSGRVGTQRVPPDRTLQAAVDLLATTRAGEGGALSTTVSGRLEVVEGVAGAAPRERVVPVTLRFDVDPAGGAVHRSIRLEAPADLAPDLEVLAAVFTDRFRFPAERVRAGDVFPPGEVLFLEDALARPLYFLFLRRAQAGEGVAAPVEGRVVVEAREVWGGEDVLRTRIAVTHAYQGDTDVSAPTDENVRIDYRAAVEGVVRIAVEGGWPRSAELGRRRRLGFRGAGFDYVVETEGTVALETVRERP